MSSLATELGGKTISIDVEVVYSPLDYNILLVCSWFYAVISIASLVFHVFQFPHQGKIVTIDQLDYCTPDLHTHVVNNVPFLGYSRSLYESVGEGIHKDSLLMGTFPLFSPSPPHHNSIINTILTLSQRSHRSNDPRVVPSPFDISSLIDVSQDHIPFLSSSSCEPIVLITYKLRRTKRKGVR